MIINPGNKKLLNKLVGIAQTVHITDDDRVAFGDRILPANILFLDDHNKLYATDGVTRLDKLEPIEAKGNTFTDEDKAKLDSMEIASGNDVLTLFPVKS